MKTRNHSKHGAFAFRKYNPKGDLNAVATAVGIYDISPNNSLSLITPQPAIQKSDEYFGPGDPPRHMVSQADFVAYKPATDVTAIGLAYPPNGQPERSWPVELIVRDRHKKLRVTGKRNWIATMPGVWLLEPPDLASTVSLDYFRAYGGLVPRSKETDEPQECDIFNPIGCGIINRHARSEAGGKGVIPAPQVEAWDDPITKSGKRYRPEGFAPIAPVWRWREQYVGSYDQEWIDNQHPFLPLDFDYRFYNCAHPDLIFDPHLEGGERLQLINMHPTQARIDIRLPEITMGAVAEMKNGRKYSNLMLIDGVHFDTRHTPARVRITWRTAFPFANHISTIHIGQVPKQALKQKEVAHGGAA